MSTATTLAVGLAARQDRPLKPLTSWRALLRARFYRFLQELPERYEPVDPEVLKRVPVPV